MTRIISALLILLAASAHAQVIGVLSNLLATAATPLNSPRRCWNSTPLLSTLAICTTCASATE